MLLFATTELALRLVAHLGGERAAAVAGAHEATALELADGLADGVADFCDVAAPAVVELWRLGPWRPLLRPRAVV